MYKYIFTILLVLLTGRLLAQHDTSKRDTPKTVRPAVQTPVRRVAPVRHDSLGTATPSVQQPIRRTVPATGNTPAAAQGRTTVVPPRRTVPAVKKDSTRTASNITAPQAATDSSHHHHAAVQPTDAVSKWEHDTLFRRIFKVPYLPTRAAPVAMFAEEHVPENKDILFYLLVGVVLFLAFIRVAFTKFFNNTFRLFFQTSFRQKQGREQLSQDNLPSLLMNLLFILVAGLFITIVASQKNWVPVSFWWLLLYSTLVLLGIYLIKYLFIRFAGWVFNVRDAADTYSFIVFLVNKIAAVALLPLLMLAAFSSGQVNDIVLTITGCLVAVLLLYRYAVSLGAVRKSLQVNAFHFFLYLCAVEIIPLLLIYKVLFNKIGFSI